MPENIDYKFLSDLEGGSKTIGYVPAVGVSISGVIIATPQGFDNQYSSPIDFHLSSATFATQLRALPKPYFLQYFFGVKFIQTLQNIDQHFTVRVQNTIIPCTTKTRRQDMLQYQP